MASLEEKKALPGDATAWRERVESELGTASFDEALVRRTHEGLELSPLYTESGSARAVGLGRRSLGMTGGTRGWKIAQEVASPQTVDAAAEILAGRESGVELFWLKLRRRTEAGRHKSEAPGVGTGIETVDSKAVKDLLEALGTESEVVLDSGGEASELAAQWIAGAQDLGLDVGELKGSFGHDPLAALATTGTLSGSLEEAFRQVQDLMAWAGGEAPEMRCLLVSSVPYHDAGCTIAEELAFSLATGVEYLRRLTDGGIPLEIVTQHFDFRFSVGRDLFLEIAKLRAMRILWSKVLEAWDHGLAIPRLRIHARASSREMTQLDPWMNLLRGGAQGCSAILGGADSLVTMPFDEVAGGPHESSRRLAVNAQHVLRAEANLARVADPAGGSWYLEALTDQLARTAWGSFREIEGQGGMARCLLQGLVAEWILDSAAKRLRAVHLRTEPIVGVSGFVNLETEVVDGVATGDEAEAESPTSGPSEAFASEAAGRLRGSRLPLAALRIAERFEALRGASDRWLVETGSRPTAGLVNPGDLPRIDQRMAFVRRLLAAGGIDSLEVGSSATLTQTEGLHIAVFFLEGTTPTAEIRDLAQRCRDGGVSQILASTSENIEEEARRPFVFDGLLFEGCDVFATLRSLLENLGVLR